MSLLHGVGFLHFVGEQQLALPISALLVLLILIAVDLMHSVVEAADVVHGHNVFYHLGPETETSHECENLSEHTQPALPGRNADLRDVL